MAATDNLIRIVIQDDGANSTYRRTTQNGQPAPLPTQPVPPRTPTPPTPPPVPAPPPPVPPKPVPESTAPSVPPAPTPAPTVPAAPPAPVSPPQGPSPLLGPAFTPKPTPEPAPKPTLGPAFTPKPPVAPTPTPAPATPQTTPPAVPPAPPATNVAPAVPPTPLLGPAFMPTMPPPVPPVPVQAPTPAAPAAPQRDAEPLPVPLPVTVTNPTAPQVNVESPVVPTAVPKPEPTAQPAPEPRHWLDESPLAPPPPDVPIAKPERIFGEPTPPPPAPKPRVPDVKTDTPAARKDAAPMPRPEAPKPPKVEPLAPKAVEPLRTAAAAGVPGAGSAAAVAGAAGPAAIAMAAVEAVKSAGASVRAQIESVGDLAGKVAKSDPNALGDAANKAAEALGKVSVVGGEVAKTLVSVATTFGKVITAFTDRGKELQSYSPQLAMANAQAEIRKISMDMREAFQLGPSLAKLTEQQSQNEQMMRELLLPIQKFLVEKLGYTLEVVTGFIEWIKPYVEKAFDLIVQIGKYVQKIMENIPGVKDVLGDIAEVLGDFRNRARKPDLAFEQLEKLWNRVFGFGTGVNPDDGGPRNEDFWMTNATAALRRFAFGRK